MTSFKRIVGAWLLSCLVIFVVSGQSDKKLKSETLFSVNKSPVLTDEFLYLYKKNHQNKPEEFTENKIEEYLKLFINYKLKVEEALNRGLDTTASFKKEFNTYHEELLKPYLPDAKVVDSLVALTYDRLKHEIKASHILINLKPEAAPSDTVTAFKKILALRRRVLEGENFNEVAAKHSEEPGAESTGGMLGYFTAMQMVYPFEQAAYNTPVGQLSEPLRTRFGYHIISIHDKKPSRGEVEISHIMIRTGDPSNSAHAKDIIFDIYDQLQKGVSWEELCSQYSEDPNSKDQGGRLRPFGVGAMASVPQFEEMAFSLRQKGDISDPFQTSFGWHILRLESKIPLPAFQELKTSLTNRVSRDERVQISKQALRERMKSEFGYTENQIIRTNLMAQVDSSLTKGLWSPSLSSSSQQDILFTMQGRPFRVKDFLHYVTANQTAVTLPAQEYIKQLYGNYVDSVQIQLLEEKIKQESPDYKWLLKEYYEGILLFEIMEKEVWNKASEDTVGQLNFFNTHRQNYDAKDRISGKIYSSGIKNTLDQLQDLLISGDSSVQQFIISNKIRQESGPFEKEDRPVLSKINWTPGFKMSENNGMNYLIFIENILPPGPKTFSESRSSVISDYQTYLEESWISQLRKKFRVEISKKARRRAIEELLH